jgi:lipopolysaccharide biosynthesis glycosyltransferase
MVNSVRTGGDGPIRVVLTTDDAYALPATVTLRSLLDAYRASRPLELYVIDGGLSDDSRRRLVDSCGGRVTLLPPIEVPSMAENALGFHAVVCLRLQLPQIFPQFERLIYIDSDVLVLDCVSKLWDEPLPEGIPLGAVLSYLTPRGHETLVRQGFTRESRNFNSGVLLMELKELGQPMKAAAEIAARERLMLPDQDALNLVLDRRWRSLAPRWNVQQHPWFHMTGHYSAPWVLSGDYTDAEVADVLERPAIVHFCNVIKPWHLDAAMPYVKPWMDCALATEWRDALPSYSKKTTAARVEQAVLKELHALAPGISRDDLRAFLSRSGS